MKQQEVFTKIGGIIKELNDQYKYLATNPEKLNELELEFFVANTQFLAHNAAMLQKLNAQNKTVVQTEKISATSPEKYFEPLARYVGPLKEGAGIDKQHTEIEPAVNSSNGEAAPETGIPASKAADNYSSIKNEPEVIRHELDIDESWTDDEEETADEPIKVELPVSPARPVNFVRPIVEKQPQPMHDTTEVLTVNEKMLAQLGHKKGAELSIVPISDLKSAITLNDKLLFIRDLFNGYSLAYSEAIEILNRCTNIEEADRFLKSNYTAKNHWDDKPDTTEKFYALLKRRYI